MAEFEQTQYRGNEGMTYAISTANKLDARTPQVIFQPIEAQVHEARQAGYEGVELWSLRMTPQIQIRTGMMTDYAKDGIVSMHQSPRRERIQDIHSSRDAQVVFALPPLHNSLTDLQRIKDQVGDIPTVLYRDVTDRPESFEQAMHFANSLIQVDPDTAKVWGVTDINHFFDKAQESGFKGICLDTKHIRRPTMMDNERTPSPFTDWEKTLSELHKRDRLEEIKSVHVAVGRVDLPGDSTETVNEMKDLIYGTDKTDILPMLRFLNERGWHGLVVVEALPSAMAQILKEQYGKAPRFFSENDLVGIYSGMRETFRGVFGQ